MNQIAALGNRPIAYHNIDGVGELGIGFMCSSFALLGWMQVHTPEHSLWNHPATLYVFMAVVCSLIHYGTKAIKSRITYPRTGFVQYSRRDTLWKPALIGLTVSLPASILVALGIRRHWELPTPASLIGLVFAASYAHGFARSVRWKWAVVWALTAASILIALLPSDLVASLTGRSWITATVSARTVGAFWLSLVLYAVLLLLSGGISFWLYLRQTQHR